MQSSPSELKNQGFLRIGHVEKTVNLFSCFSFTLVSGGPDSASRITRTAPLFATSQILLQICQIGANIWDVVNFVLNINANIWHPEFCHDHWWIFWHYEYCNVVNSDLNIGGNTCNVVNFIKMLWPIFTVSCLMVPICAMEYIVFMNFVIHLAIFWQPERLIPFFQKLLLQMLSYA